MLSKLHKQRAINVAGKLWHYLCQSKMDGESILPFFVPAVRRAGQAWIFGVFFFRNHERVVSLKVPFFSKKKKRNWC